MTSMKAETPRIVIALGDTPNYTLKQLAEFYQDSVSNLRASSRKGKFPPFKDIHRGHSIVRKEDAIIYDEGGWVNPVNEHLVMKSIKHLNRRRGRRARDIAASR